MWDQLVLVILSLAFVLVARMIFLIIIFAKVEQQKKLEAEMERMRREYLDE